jgi:hypothetical protein
MYTLIQTAMLNGVDPQAWLADVLDRIADHPITDTIYLQEIERVMIAVLVRGRSQSFNLLSVDSPRVLQVAPTFDPLGMMGSRPGLPIFSPLNGLRMRAYFRRFVMPSRGRVPAIPRPSAGFLTRGEAALAFGALRHGPSCSL